MEDEGSDIYVSDEDVLPHGIDDLYKGSTNFMEQKLKIDTKSRDNIVSTKKKVKRVLEKLEEQSSNRYSP